MEEREKRPFDLIAQCEDSNDSTRPGGQHISNRHQLQREGRLIWS